MLTIKTTFYIYNLAVFKLFYTIITITKNPCFNSACQLIYNNYISIKL